MNTHRFIIVLATLALSVHICASKNDTIQTGFYKRKAINLNSSLSYGTELTLSSRVEYESKFGKLNFMAEIGGTKGGILLDIGAGYGYPIIYNKSNALFVNGNITYINIGLKAVLYGPTAMWELEYRKSWGHFSVNIVPFYRRMFIENPEIGIEYNKNAYGLKIGAIYSFWIK